jgi:DTW domain-containing protein YfiP
MGKPKKTPAEIEERCQSCRWPNGKCICAERASFEALEVLRLIDEAAADWLERGCTDEWKAVSGAAMKARQWLTGQGVA